MVLSISSQFALEHPLVRIFQEVTMILAIAFLLAAASVNSQEIIPANYRDYRNYQNYGVSPYYHHHDETPKPYAFSYNAPLDDGVGHSSRTESADGSGKVEGSYTVTNDEGHTRVVDYVADELGFRASIRTNEPGTDNKNPADVVIESAAPFNSYQYVPRARRPIGSPAVDPVISPISPEVVTENLVAPVQPGFYNMPRYNTNRNYYRPRARYPYVRY